MTISDYRCPKIIKQPKSMLTPGSNERWQCSALNYSKAYVLMSLLSFTGIWSECNRSENSVDIKKSDSPTPPVWTPKSAPSSPSVERKFRPVPFESPTLQRKNRAANGGTTPPPWTQPNYPDKPYQPSIIKSSSWNAISTPKPVNHIIYRKARGE